METLIVALSPFITNALTGWMKSWSPFSGLTDEARKPVVRFLAAVLSLAYVMGGAWVTGNVEGSMLSVSFQGVVVAFVAWLGSIGSYSAFFHKK